jgi:ATP-dependent Clp protease protease subunit
VSGAPDWLREKLFERRIVLVTGRLDDAVAARAAAELMGLAAAGDGPIELQVDSPAGTLEAAFVLIDTLELLRAPVHAHCRGTAGGPGVGVVAVVGDRSAAPHARFRLVQPRVQLVGTPEQVAAQTRAHRDLLVRFQARLARATGRSVDEIADDMRGGRYLDARQALDYGLIDRIAGSPSP